MKKVKATVISKRVLKSFWSKDKYMLGLQFHDIYNNKSGENTKEMMVSFIAYNDLKINDVVLCPMKNEPKGLTFDFSKPIEKI